MKEETTPWIKASERLPAKGQKVIYWDPRYKQHILYDIFDKVKYYDLDNIEWLDESVIVRACNAHDDMLEALEKLLEQFIASDYADNRSIGNNKEVAKEMALNNPLVIKAKAALQKAITK